MVFSESIGVDVFEDDDKTDDKRGKNEKGQWNNLGNNRYGNSQIRVSEYVEIFNSEDRENGDDIEGIQTAKMRRNEKKKEEKSAKEVHTSVGNQKNRHGLRIIFNWAIVIMVTLVIILISAHISHFAYNNLAFYRCWQRNAIILIEWKFPVVNIFVILENADQIQYKSREEKKRKTSFLQWNWFIYGFFAWLVGYWISENIRFNIVGLMLPNNNVSWTKKYQQQCDTSNWID